ncbi:MAG: DUF87 domain-containing protein [Bryobacterales bacterium]
MTEDYEKLGAFYLGRGYDLNSHKLLDDLVLYDSKDLVTHGVCFGMTGSGKTGLCACLLEEALIDGIPVIAIDPKGDLGNLLLTFPDLKPENFEPWIAEGAARREGLQPSEYAQKQADLWRKGLASWGQDGERIRRLRNAADFAIYTPGSSAGLPVSLLKSFQAPSPQVQEDEELLRERTQAAVSGLLGLLGIEADPIQSRDHILLSLIFDHSWTQGRDVSLAELIQQIQKPPFDRVGLFDLESYYPSKDRTALAMALNNLLASPGFSAWLEGEPLDVDRLLYTSKGQPRLSIFSIAHLSDSERMFFVSMLLNEIVSWMRRQSGTSTLRALLYMDEMFGFLPPVANPPSKGPLLTLLKQARAFGLGVLMATQNPKDIDYKALSNTGTWFVGRLQTDRDQERVLDGLEGAAAGSGSVFNRKAAQAKLASLDSRVFLLHNVHDDAPREFHTRWALSYLSGPLTRVQIKKLMAERRQADEEPRASGTSSPSEVPFQAAKAASRPILPAGIPEYFAPLRSAPAEGSELIYQPAVLGMARTHYEDKRRKIDYSRELSVIVRIEDGPAGVAWDQSSEVRLSANDLASEPHTPSARHGELPKAALVKTSYSEWQKDLVTWIYSEQPLVLFYSPSLKESSRPEESERDFRIRLDQLAREERDQQLEKLREKHAPKVARIEERIRRAEGAVEREKEQAKQQTMQSTISIGATLIGALFGRKLASATNVRGAGSAVRSISRARKESGDIERAEEDLDSLRQQLQDLDADFRADCEGMESKIDPRTEELETERVRPKKSSIDVRFCAFTWFPYWRAKTGATDPAWE